MKSPMIMFIRRSNLSATAPASGPKMSAGSSDVSHTPVTAYPLPVGPPSFRASADSASRLSQSPKLDSESAIQSRRNGVIESTPVPLAAKGDLKFTGLGYRACHGRVALSAKLHPFRQDNSDGNGVRIRRQPLAGSGLTADPVEQPASGDPRLAGSGRKPEPGAGALVA